MPFLSNPNSETQLCACIFDFKQWIVVDELRIVDIRRIWKKVVKPVFKDSPSLKQ
jgi:hypothetical protein